MDKIAIIPKPVATGSVTQANMKISAVDGTAFVDFTAATILTGKLGHLLKVKDSAGRAIQSFSRAAGTSETLDATNLVTEWTNVSYDSFTSVASPDIAAAVYTTTGTQTATSNSMVTAVGKLYKLVTTWTNVAGQAPTLTGTNGFVTTTLSAGANNIYFTATGTSVVITTTNTAAASWGCTFVLKQVTTPSATGVTISSTKGGTAMDAWAQKDAAFNYNDPAGYTYEIYKVLSAPVVATGTIAAGAMKMDTTTANAFSEFGVDLSAYQDGRHILALYNTTGGYAALAHISATAPGGETLATTGGPLNNGELVTDPGFDDDGSWTKDTGWTISGSKAVATSVLVNQCVYQTISYPVGGLVKLVSIMDVLTLGTWTEYVPGLGTVFLNNHSTADTFTYYRNAVVGTQRIGLCATTTLTGTSPNISAKQVTAPATTGALLLSTKGGSRGFIDKSASFNPNAEITYKVLYVGD
jgi:hypothetical protein